MLSLLEDEFAGFDQITVDTGTQDPRHQRKPQFTGKHGSITKESAPPTRHFAPKRIVEQVMAKSKVKPRLSQPTKDAKWHAGNRASIILRYGAGGGRRRRAGQNRAPARAGCG